MSTMSSVSSFSLSSSPSALLASFAIPVDEGEEQSRTSTNGQSSLLLLTAGEKESSGSTTALVPITATATIATPQPPLLLVDALPYIDTHFTTQPALKTLAQQLIREEMERGAAEHSLDEYAEKVRQLPSLLEFSAHASAPIDADDVHVIAAPSERLRESAPLFCAGLARFAEAQSFDASDPHRMALQARLSKVVHVPDQSLDQIARDGEGGADKHVREWRNIRDRVATRVEEQKNRRMNLELLKRFGANAWVVHSQHMAKIRDTLSQRTDAQQQHVDSIHRKRKSSQIVDTAPTLQAYEHEWYSWLHQNATIRAEIKRLRRQIETRVGSG